MQKNLTMQEVKQDIIPKEKETVSVNRTPVLLKPLLRLNCSQIVVHVALFFSEEEPRLV